MLDVIISKLDSAKGDISGLEAIAIEFIQIEAHREKRMNGKYE